MREFLKQHLTEKQNGYLQSGRLQEVFAYERWSFNRRELTVYEWDACLLLWCKLQIMVNITWGIQDGTTIFFAVI